MSESTREQDLKILQDAVTAAGGDRQMFQYLSSIMNAESSSRYSKNSQSKATGLFQFTPDTWNRMGGGDIYSPEDQCRNAVKLARQNAEGLQKALGHEPDAGELYLAHFAGLAGAKAALAAPDDTPIGQFLSAGALHANSKKLNGKQGVVFRGKDFADFTAEDLREWAAARMDVALDTRLAYDRETTHTQAETAKELADRQRIAEEFGMDANTVKQLGPMILFLGFIFQIIQGLNASAPVQSADGGDGMNTDGEKPIDPASTYSNLFSNGVSAGTTLPPAAAAASKTPVLPAGAQVQKAAVAAVGVK